MGWVKASLGTSSLCPVLFPSFLFIGRCQQPPQIIFVITILLCVLSPIFFPLPSTVLPSQGRVSYVSPPPPTGGGWLTPVNVGWVLSPSTGSALTGRKSSTHFCLLRAHQLLLTGRTPPHQATETFPGSSTAGAGPGNLKQPAVMALGHYNIFWSWKEYLQITKITPFPSPTRSTQIAF